MSVYDDSYWIHDKLVYPGVVNLWLMVSQSVRYVTDIIIFLTFLAKRKGQLWESQKSLKTTGAE